MDAPSDEWLEQTNVQFGKDNIPHRQRPWLAWRKWAMESGQSLAPSDPAVKRIFEWFKEHTKEGSQQIGNLYVGTFLYDAEVWPVAVPVFFGTRALRPLDSLPSMPESVKTRLHNNERAWSGLVAAFADCLDVGLLPQRCAADFALSPDARKWLASGGATLSAASELLLLRNPNPKALGTARFATEIFLKSYLAAKDGLTDAGAKKEYGHNLSTLMRRVLEIAPPGSDFAEIEPRLTIFPDEQERYENNIWPVLTLWNGYSVALHTAATVLRLLTGEDSRKAMRVPSEG
jgi:hypothetical protein